jgi:hypothetical protein
MIYGGNLRDKWRRLMETGGIWFGIWINQKHVGIWIVTEISSGKFGIVMQTLIEISVSNECRKYTWGVLWSFTRWSELENWGGAWELRWSKVILHQKSKESSKILRLEEMNQEKWFKSSKRKVRKHCGWLRSSSLEIQQATKVPQHCQKLLNSFSSYGSIWLFRSLTNNKWFNSICSNSLNQLSPALSLFGNLIISLMTAR